MHITLGQRVFVFVRMENTTELECLSMVPPVDGLLPNILAGSAEVVAAACRAADQSSTGAGANTT